MEIECEGCENRFHFETENEVFLNCGDRGNVHHINCPHCNFCIVIKTYPSSVN